MQVGSIHNVPGIVLFGEKEFSIKIAQYHPIYKQNNVKDLSSLSA